MIDLTVLHHTISPGGLMRLVSEVGRFVRLLCVSYCFLGKLGGGNLTRFFSIIEASSGTLCPVGPVHVSISVISWSFVMSIREIS